MIPLLRTQHNSWSSCGFFYSLTHSHFTHFFITLIFTFKVLSVEWCIKCRIDLTCSTIKSFLRKGDTKIFRNLILTAKKYLSIYEELILREVTNRQTETLMVNKLLHMFFHMAVPAWALKSRKPQRIDNKVQKRSIFTDNEVNIFREWYLLQKHEVGHEFMKDNRIINLHALSPF